MDFKIIKQNKNALFDREDITFKATGTGATPTRQETSDLIAAKIGHKAETIAIISIDSEFGKDSIRGLAHVYKSKEELERKEPKYIVKRNTPKPKKETEAAPAPVAEAKPEEKPAEEKKEEPKAEVSAEEQEGGNQ
ncbi:30S ribosomal protein S24e [Candidatus Woesearchaeota archaeon]|jgi:small subunit ribosomal protein S24e|nr:30S ribosomal protein S24e [Candidatus Woesearchaeota archaeon]MBT7062555.1 30S ribosomal protein S24e [Candidatus Woesearchaeota archaeon]